MNTPTETPTAPTTTPTSTPIPTPTRSAMDSTTPVQATQLPGSAGIPAGDSALRELTRAEQRELIDQTIGQLLMLLQPKRGAPPLDRKDRVPPPANPGGLR